MLERWQVQEDAITAAVVIAGELIANAVTHAETDWQLVLDLRGCRLRIAVDDGLVGPCPASSRSSRQYVSGLRLINAAALRWGWQEHEAGKTVWADVAI